MNDAVLMPVYNEAKTVGAVLDAVRSHFAGEIIVVDDGSADDTRIVLAGRDDITVISHSRNLGYGAALACGFAFARESGVENLVTMDCDGQHEPAHIPEFLSALGPDDDIISGSRYMPDSGLVGEAPPQRMEINRRVTAEINARTGWGLTDAFCGFKAYRVAALEGMHLRERGYAMPLEFWAWAYKSGLSVREMAVERIYCDHQRTFGEQLDDPEVRYAYYMRVWRASLDQDG